MISSDDIMTPAEVATFLKVKVSTVYAWVHLKKIPHIKRFGRLRFLRSEIEAWLKGKKGR
jgi:excisionase family DNA binding protein